MPAPFSDTDSPNPQRRSDHEQATILASRLGLPELRGGDLGRWQSILFSAVIHLLDRLEALETGQKRAP